MEKSNVEKVAEKICEENKELRAEIEDKKCQIEEMRHHIDCLKADLAEAQDNEIGFPLEPIKVAEMLIDADAKYVIQREFRPDETKTWKLYCKSDLRQIAEHLLVYCNNAEDE